MILNKWSLPGGVKKPWFENRSGSWRWESSETFPVEFPCPCCARCSPALPLSWWQEPSSVLPLSQNDLPERPTLALWCGGSLGLWSEPAWLERLGVLQNFQQPLTESFVFLFPQLTKVTSKVLSEQPKSRQLMTSDQDTKVVAEPQVQQVQEVKDGSHLVSIISTYSPGINVAWNIFFIML